MADPSKERETYFGDEPVLTMSLDCPQTPHWHRDVMRTHLQIIWHDPARGLAAGKQFAVTE